jgi:hypothetical protein
MGCATDCTPHQGRLLSPALLKSCPPARVLKQRVRFVFNDEFMRETEEAIAHGWEGRLRSRPYPSCVITALLSRIKASNMSKTAASAASESLSGGGLAGHLRRICEEIIQRRGLVKNHRSVRS